MKTITSPRAARRRILIVDDHPITRLGLKQLLDGAMDLMVCGEADSAQEAMGRLKMSRPDLLVTDVAMPGKNVIEFIKDLQVLHPDLPILVLSTCDENLYAERLIRAGARGYIMKSEGGASLLKAIRQILTGQPYLSAAMSARVFQSFAGKRTPADNLLEQRLTDREFEILQLLGEGKTSREVARELSLSPKTVQTHREHLSRKLGLRTSGQLMRYAVEWRSRQTG